MKCCLFCTCAVLSSVPQLENEPEAVQIGDSPKEVPFTIPKKWKWLKLSSVFRLKAGKFISSSEIKEAGKYPCFGGNGIRGYVDHYNKEGKFPLIGRQGALCGNINIADGRFYATEHAVVADGGELIDSDCAAYFLKQLNLNQYATKTAQPGISVKRISETPFPLPSLEEQRRIVTKINQLFEQIDCAEKAYNELSGPLSERFRQLCLEKAIQGKLVPQLESEPEVEQIGEAPEDAPFAIPEKWKWTRLSSVANCIAGQSPEGNSINEQDGIEFHQGKTYFSKKYLCISSKKTLTPRKVIEDFPAIVLSVRAPVGDVNIVDRKICIGRGLFGLIARDILDVNYLFYVMEHRSKDLEKLATGTTFKAVNSKVVHNFPIPLPPLEEQRRIVVRLNELLGSVAQIEGFISTP